MAQGAFDKYGVEDIEPLAFKRQLYSMGGRPVATARVAATDTAAALPDASIKDANGNYASAVLITVETQAVRIAFGTNPTQGASGVGHVLAAGSTFTIQGPDMVAAAKVINSTNGQVGILQVTGVF